MRGERERDCRNHTCRGHMSHECHRYDFLVRLWNGLNFFKLYFHLGLITTPHVLYVHMTYVYSISYVSHFTRSYGQEKSLSYYDLFDFRVLFYGCTPTLISIFFFNNTTLILTINILIVWANLQQDMTRTRHMEWRKISSIRRRTLLSPH